MVAAYPSSPAACTLLAFIAVVPRTLEGRQGLRPDVRTVTLRPYEDELPLTAKADADGMRSAAARPITEIVLNIGLLLLRCTKTAAPPLETNCVSSCYYAIERDGPIARTTWLAGKFRKLLRARRSHA